MKKDLAAAALGMAAVWTMISSANAATINVTYTEVSVGLGYTIGYGPVTVDDATSGVSDGQRPVVIQLGGYTEGYYPTIPPPGEFNSIGVDSTASASIAYDATVGTAPSIYGTSSASIDFANVANRGVGFASAPSSQNYVLYKFEVLDGPVDYSVSFDNDVTGYLSLKTLAGGSVLNLGAGLDHQSTLDPDIYTLQTFLTFGVTSTQGARSGSNSFAMTFEDSTLTVNPVPLPAAIWFFGTALGGLFGVNLYNERKLTAQVNL